MVLRRFTGSVVVGLHVVLAAGCSSTSDKETSIAPLPPKVSVRKLTVLHTNDTHGRFWHNSEGEYGMAAQKTLVDRLRAEAKAGGSEVLMLSGGDVNTGVPESDLLHAEPDFVAMNRIGYDAMAVGNHEFDNPLDILQTQRGWAQFPMLSANIYDKAKGTRYFDPYKVFALANGLRVAVVGFTTEDTAVLSNPEHVASLDFRDPKAEAATLIKDIRDRKEADIVLAITHMGHYSDAKYGSNAPGDVTMARALPPGLLDAIIGGHSQNAVCMEVGGTNRYANFQPGDKCLPDKQNGTWIMQAQDWGKYVGRAQFEVLNGKLKLLDYDLIPVNLVRRNPDMSPAKDAAGNLQFVQTEIPKDPDLLAVLKPFQEKGQEELGVVLASTDAVLDGERSSVRTRQTNLGRLISLATAEALRADFGIINSGGIRASMAAGPIRYRDVLAVHPFGNTVNQAFMKGSELTTYLGVVATKNINFGGYPQFGGITMQVDCLAKSVQITSIAGKPFDADATYRFSIPSFSAAGGDGYPVIPTRNAGATDADVLVDYLTAKKAIRAADYEPNGEVTFANSASTTGCQ